MKGISRQIKISSELSYRLNSINQMSGSTWASKVKNALALITVEPTMVLYMMAFMTTTVVEQAFFVDRACRTNHHFDASICDNLTSEENKDYNKKVQVSQL